MAEEPRPPRDRSWIKRSPRVDGHHEALVVDSQGRSYPVTILDLSSGGFKLQSDETFRIGEYIGLKVERYGEFSAQIRWALGNEAGGVFLDPIVLPSD
jgi:hypothetical protein